MPRMTRAALRAQQVDNEQEPQQESQTPLAKEQRRQTRSVAQIHEDLSENEVEEGSETQKSGTTIRDHPSERSALRDITDENYPIAEVDLSETNMEKEKQELDNAQSELHELRKSTRKGRGKSKSRTRKVEAVTLVEPGVDEATKQGKLEHLDSAVPETEPTSLAEEPVQNEELPELESHPETDVREVDTTVDEEIEPQLSIESLVPKTPKFDPDVYQPDHEASTTTEDSFVHSITSRSPTKLGQSQMEDSHPSQQLQPCSSSLQAQTPLRRASSTNFEESFEALDSLEDTIEQVTAGLPVLSAEQVDVPDSPAKVNPTPLRAQLSVATSNISATRTPRSNVKLYSVRKAQNKESTPLKTRTPLSKHTTPVKTATPVAKQSTPFKPITPSVTELTTSKTTRMSARKSASKPAVGTKSDATAPMPKKQETTEHQHSISFSNYTAKQQPNTQKKRNTSNVLSTAKSGFVPAKSTKPPTCSSFALPGEAVAEKLKAQREAREEKMKQPKMSLAEEKAAKLKADREAREERVRQNQERAREASNSDKPKPAPKNTRPLSVHMQPSIAPRENRASQARMSRLFSGPDKENVAPQPTTVAAPSTSRAGLIVSKTRTDPTITAKSNTAANRKSIIDRPSTRGPSTTTTTPRPSSVVPPSAQDARIASISNGQRSTVTKEDAAHQKVRGKEVFMRARQTLDQEAKEKREKEEAARKARIEAAAAGRQASREWAERMTKRKQTHAQAQVQHEERNEVVATAVQVSAVESA